MRSVKTTSRSNYCTIRRLILAAKLLWRGGFQLQEPGDDVGDYVLITRQPSGRQEARPRLHRHLVVFAVCKAKAKV